MKATNTAARTSTITTSTMIKGLQLLASNLSTVKAVTRKYRTWDLSVTVLIEF